MKLERLQVRRFRFKFRRFDTLAQAVLTHQGNNLGGVLFLGVDPPDHLVQVQGRSGHGFVQGRRLHHGFANGGARLLHFGNDRGVIKDATRDLTMVARNLGFG